MACMTFVAYKRTPRPSLLTLTPDTELNPNSNPSSFGHIRNSYSANSVNPIIWLLVIYEAVAVIRASCPSGHKSVPSQTSPPPSAPAALLLLLVLRVRLPV